MNNNSTTRILMVLFAWWLSLAANAQNISVTGTVTALDEGPLPGVNILVKGTTQGTVTDIDGNYSINVPSRESVLVFSSIGYTSEEVTVGNQTTINVELMPDIKSLSEVVVVGYGTQERGVVTGAVSSVNMQDVESLPLTSVEQTLQGRVPGVLVTQTGGGTPGGAMQVNIRGIGSINGETPLYVIDGVQVQQGQQGPGGYSILNSLNPNDIESIDILKDASATAIYGSRASGGVVIITTKRGKEGPVKVNFDAYYGMQSQGQFYDVLNGPQYISYLQKLHSGPDGQLPTAFDPNAEAENPGRLLNTDINTNWQDELFNPAPIQNYNVSLSGGNENAVFAIGAEYFSQEGTMLGTQFDRFSLRANSDFKIGKKIKIGETLLFSKTYRQRNDGSGGRQPQEHAIKQAPTVAIYDEGLLGGFGFPDTDEGQDAQNPVADANIFTRDEDRYRFFGSIFGEWEIVPSLTYKLQLGLDFGFQDNLNYNPRYQQVRRIFTPSAIDKSRSLDFNPLIEQYLTYDKAFGKHNVTVLAGWSAQSFSYTNLTGRGQELPVGVVAIGAASVNLIPGDDTQETALRSFFGRLTYAFADRYLLTANIRRDQSSKLFRGNNPVGVFPSVSLGWRVSEEAFMEGIDFISDLKIRAGIGEVGNQSPLGNYPTDVNLATNYYYVLGNQPVQGINQRELANPDIKWETSRQIDIGFDLGLLDNRVFVNFDYYKRNTVDLIWRATVPPSLGLVAPFVNSGEIQNSGIELGLTYRKSVGDFQFDASANMTTINNKVISLVREDLIIKEGSVTDDISGVSWTQVGEPIGTFYGWEADGIFRNWDEVYAHAYQNQATITGETQPNGAPAYDNTARDAETAVNRTAPGDIRWRDVNEDGIIDTEDQVALGSPVPDFIYGFNFNGRYRNFDFQLFLQGAQGHQLYNAAKRWLVDFRQNFNQGIEAVDAAPYSPEYTASEPRIVRADPNRNVLRSSDRYISDGSYARIKNLSIGYNFSAPFLERINATNLRVYATAQNLATFTNYFGLEPEVGSRSGDPRQNGIDRLQYPQPRTFILGVQVGF